MTRDETAEPVSRNQILRRERGQGNTHFPCSVDHEQLWQLYTVDPHSAISDDRTHTEREREVFVTSIIDPPLGGSMRAA